MTVKQLIKALQAMPQDATVAVVKDWMADCDEQGNLPTDEITDVSIQRYIDVQFGDKEYDEVIMII